VELIVSYLPQVEAAAVVMVALALACQKMPMLAVALAKARSFLLSFGGKSRKIWREMTARLPAKYPSRPLPHKTNRYVSNRVNNML
jgi:hypothetical protein